MADHNCTPEKRCSKCGVTKSIEEFTKQKVRKDGLNPWCKTCKSIAGKDYFNRNREKKLAQNKAWQDANKDEVRRYHAAYYQANRKKCDAATAAWIKAHPEINRKQSLRDYYKHKEKRLSRSRAYRIENIERIKEISRLWRKNNVERHRALSRSYKARKRGAEGNHTGNDILRLLYLQKHKCIYCKKSIKNGYHVDHIMPLSLGGSNNPDNLQLLCPTCNMSKSAKHPIDFANENGLIF